MHMSTVTLNYTNAIFHHKTPLFECFAVENPICASVNYDFECGFPQQTTSLRAFYSRKTALCKSRPTKKPLFEYFAGLFVHL